VPVSEPVVVVEELSVDLGAVRVLREIGLRVATGEVVALLGANGSGKSTLVRTMLGLVPITTGRVELYGRPVSEFTGWDRIGYVPQRVTAAAGVPATVAEVVASGQLTRRSWWRRESRTGPGRVARSISAVGLDGLARRQVQRLSGGQQQRVLIARALAREPGLLVLDEPTAGVDLPSQQAFAVALGRLVAKGTTVLLVLHELGALAPLIGRAVVLRAGRVVHDGAPPPAVDHHAAPEHDHVHPHETLPADAGLLP
jgi:zinc transport system ATP-binding protein